MGMLAAAADNFSTLSVDALIKAAPFQTQPSGALDAGRSSTAPAASAPAAPLPPRPLPGPRPLPSPRPLPPPCSPSSCLRSRRYCSAGLGSGTVIRTPVV
ncbi:MAG: hypothetical protein WDW38_009783 [Sanguina aurantia]